MKRRTTDRGAGTIFKTHIDEARPLKAALPKAKPRKTCRQARCRRPRRRTPQEKLKRGQLAPGARIDLHGMTEAAAHGALLSFLPAAQARGVRLALVVTGMGNPKNRGKRWSGCARRTAC